MQVALLLVISALTCGLFLLRGKSDKGDSREPPLVKSTIPFIGHVIGLLRRRFGYYTFLQYGLLVKIHGFDTG